MTTKILNPETLTKKRKLAALLQASAFAGQAPLTRNDPRRSYAALVVSSLMWLCDGEANKEKEARFNELLDRFIGALAPSKGGSQ